LALEKLFRAGEKGMQPQLRREKWLWFPGFLLVLGQGMLAAIPFSIITATLGLLGTQSSSVAQITPAADGTSTEVRLNGQQFDIEGAVFPEISVTTSTASNSLASTPIKLPIF
jgi:hypothetical protein